MQKLFSRWNSSSPDLKRFLIATFLFGLAAASYDSVFNNFLHERFDLNSIDRTILEVPREIPGLLTVVFSIMLFFIGSRRRAAWAMLFCALGSVLLASAITTYNTLLLWLFILTIGQHLWLPLSASIGMELAQSGADGRRLGQLNAIRNAAAIVGAAIIFILFAAFSFSALHRTPPLCLNAIGTFQRNTDASMR